MGTDYSAAVADPLRECAPRIVEDMNRKHWEDIRRFCNVYTRLDAEVSCLSPTGQILSLSLNRNADPECVWAAPNQVNSPIISEHVPILKVYVNWPSKSR
jgi:hypothetical protein